MASIHLGVFRGYNNSSDSGSYEVYLEYDSVTRNGNNVTINNLRVQMNRRTNKYTTNRIAICAGYNGSTNNLLYNHTINSSGSRSAPSYTVWLGSPSVTTNGNGFPVYVEVASTGSNGGWTNFQSNAVAHNGVVADGAANPTGPSTPGGASLRPSNPKPADVITFSWNPSSGGSNGVSGYRVERRVGNGGWTFHCNTSWTSITTTGNALGAGHGTVIQFKVLSYSTINGAEFTSPWWSDIQSCTVTVPKPTVSTFKKDIVNQTSIKVSVTGNIGSGLNLKGYQFSKDNGSSWSAIQPNNEYTFTGLSTYTNYSIKARIIDTGNQSTDTETLVIKTLPSDPVISSFTTSDVGITQIKLNTNATAQAGVRGYQFSKDNGKNWTNEQTTSSYVFTGLSPYTNYEFKVKVYDREGFSKESSVSKRTLADKPRIISTEILEITDELFKIRAKLSVPSVKLTKVEFKLDEGNWKEADSTDINNLTSDKKYIDLLEEKIYNVSIKATNTEGTVSDIHKTQVTTLPGKFVTIIVEGQAPRKIHTYAIFPDGSMKKLTKRTFKFIK